MNLAHSTSGVSYGLAPPLVIHLIHVAVAVKYILSYYADSSKFGADSVLIQNGHGYGLSVIVRVDHHHMELFRDTLDVQGSYECHLLKLSLILINFFIIFYIIVAMC